MADNSKPIFAAIGQLIFVSVVAMFGVAAHLWDLPATIRRMRVEAYRPHWAWYVGTFFAVRAVIGLALNIHGGKTANGAVELFFGWLAAAFFYWLAAPKDKGVAVVRGSRVVNAGDAIRETKSWADHTNIRIAGVPIPFDQEGQHFLIGGKSGAGKTVAINAMLETAQYRGDSYIVADPAGGYLSRFWRDGDLLLNPFDSRSVQWSPFAELRTDYDCQRLARAAIPEGDGDSREWNNYAQVLVAETLKACWKSGNHSTKELLRLLTAAPPGELRELIGDTPAAALVSGETGKMLGSVRGIIGTYLNAWQFLPDNGTFSVRQFVQNAEAKFAKFVADIPADGQIPIEEFREMSSGLFITYRDDQLAVLKHLISMWVELAVVEGLSLPENPTRRFWVILDELDSLGRVSALRDGLTKLRKYGMPVVAGLQTIAQLRSTYGKDFAQVLLSCMSTKLILAAGDNETGKYFENELGQVEVLKTSYTSGQSDKTTEWGKHNSTGQNHSHHIEAAVLASEIQNLPNLQGFLKVAGWPIVRVQLEYKPYAAKVDNFR